MATDKKQHWQNVVYEPSGVTPGVYDRPQLTINEFGFITDAASSITPTQTVVSLVANLPSIPSPATGDLAIVLDNGSGEEEMYVWNDANADIGAPYVKWRLLATTEDTPPRVNFRNQGVTTDAVTNIGAVTSFDAIVKAIHVTIDTVYPPGTTMRIKELGTIGELMPASSINTQLAGTYTEDLAGNNFKLATTGQLQCEIVGGPAFGIALVYVEYIVQP